MMLLTKTHRTQLLANDLSGIECPAGPTGRAMAQADISETVKPVVKLFMPDGGATWLLAWLEPDDPDIAWGLADLGFGCPEMGSVSLSDIANLRGVWGLPLLGHVMPCQPMVERDRFFKADRSLSDYAKVACDAGYIAA